MGFSVTLSHIIMVIASVCLASAFSAYAFYTGNVVQNELMQNVSDAKRMTNTQLEIVYATVDNSTSPAHFAIYAKNVGNLPLRDFAYLDIYVGEYCQAQLYSYNATAEAGSQQFNLTDANGDGDSVLESNEKAFLMIRLDATSADGMIGDYEMVKAEVRTPKGAALTVVRTAPGGMPANSFIDLG
jgi:archaellum component FlaF (FlaF/FlaG flagellin family)